VGDFESAAARVDPPRYAAAAPSALRAIKSRRLSDADADVEVVSVGVFMESARGVGRQETGDGKVRMAERRKVKGQGMEEINRVGTKRSTA
jgi:hypothetical protein